MDIKNRIVLGGQRNYSGYSKSRTSSSQKKSGTVAGKRSGGTITVRRKISAASYMTRVAQAGTKTQVEAVIRGARADLQFVRTCSTDSSEAEKAERIIKKVISKSQLKIARLKKEQNLEFRKKLSDKAEGCRIKEELRKRRMRRKAQEAADTLDPECATVERRQELREQLQEERELQQEEAAASLQLGDVESLAGLSGCDAGTEGADCGGAVDVMV